MAITFQIPRILRPYGAGNGEFQLTGATVRALLDELHRLHPALYQCVCDETGAVRRHINLFRNNDLLCRRDGLDSRLVAGDVVSVYQAVSGG